jgi:hypothetical protein
MEPIAAIIAALSAGAASGATDVTKKAITDAYNGLKALIKRKFGDNKRVSDAIDSLQANPESEGRRLVLAEELNGVKAGAEPELLNAAQSLLELVRALPQGGQYIQSAQGTGIAQASGGSTASVTMAGTPERKVG